MTETELHWLAGYLDGEGCFTFQQSPTHGGRYHNRKWRIAVTSVDQDLIEHAARLMGSTVYGPKKRPAPRQPIWQTSLQRREEVVPLLQRLRPLMSKRRQAKIDELLAAHEQYPVRPRGPKPSQSVESA